MKTNPVPWILVAFLGVYTVFFSYPKRYADDWKEIVPTYPSPTPLVEEKKDPTVLEPVSGLKVLRFWDHDDWRYVPVVTKDDPLTLIRNLTSSITGQK